MRRRGFLAALGAIPSVAIEAAAEPLTFRWTGRTQWYGPVDAQMRHVICTQRVLILPAGAFEIEIVECS